MDQQQPVNTKIRQGQFRFIGQQGQARFFPWSVDHPLSGRHDGADTRHLCHEGAKIGRCVTDTDNALAGDIGPYLTQFAPQDILRCMAQMRLVEFVEVDNIAKHAITLSEC